MESFALYGLAFIMRFTATRKRPNINLVSRQPVSKNKIGLTSIFVILHLNPKLPIHVLVLFFSEESLLLNIVANLQ